jgi:hypothetical protein
MTGGWEWDREGRNRSRGLGRGGAGGHEAGEASSPEEAQEFCLSLAHGSSP